MFFEIRAPYFVGLYMDSESNIERFDCAQHRLAVSSDDCYIKDSGWLGHIADIFADVEFLQFFLGWGHRCHSEGFVGHWK